MNNINYESYCEQNDIARLERLEEENKELKEANSNLRNLVLV